MSIPQRVAVAIICVLALLSSAGGVPVEAPDLDASEPLRELGPAGLDRALAAWEAAGTPADPDWHSFIDRVAGQRYGWASRLFWFTDRDAALELARAAGKPVVSLRLLGELTDEYSCANSRLFRTLLYADLRVSDWLRENVILHWSSERPVPMVTIDFGDGRRLERTLTGNSAHYVLDGDGRPVDVIPGLYIPRAFLERLRVASELVQRLPRDEAGRASRLAEYHTRRVTALAEMLHERIAAVRPPEELRTVAAVREAMLALPPGSSYVPAGSAVPLALTKSVIQAPVLTRLQLDLDEPRPALAMPDDREWELISRASPTSDVLSDEAIEDLVATELPARFDDPSTLAMRRMRLTLSVLEDTARNEFLLHARIHQRLSLDPLPEFDELNRWVYTSIFLTPPEDPWLGLVDPLIYTGLVDDGIREGALEPGD